MLNFFRMVLLLALGLLVANACAVGLMPTPVLNNAQISGDASFDPGSGKYSYAYALVYLNVQSLLINTPNNTVEPQISLAPKSAILSIGASQKLTVTLIDLANGSAPLVGIPIRFRVASGPDAGTVLGNTQTDAQGMATIAYTSTQTGTDNIIASALFYGGEVTYDDKGAVVWSGGPDLTVPFFSPPLLITKGGKKFYMSEETKNIGNVNAPPSVTRYYLSAAPIVDFTTAQAAQVIGERSIPTLQPGKSSSINQKVFHIPRIWWWERIIWPLARMPIIRWWN